MSDWMSYNPDGTPAGVEARYKKIGGNLFVEIDGTNSDIDWASNIIGAFLCRKRVKVARIHLIWYYYSFRFFRYLSGVLRDDKEIRRVCIRGHSAGGAWGMIIALLFYTHYYHTYFISLTAFGAPRTGLKKKHRIYKDSFYTLSFVKNPGDWVTRLPFIYQRYPAECMIITNEVKQGGIVDIHMNYRWRFNI